MNTSIYPNIKKDLESANPLENKQALLYLHREVFHLVKKFVLKSSGKNEDAEDTFQEGMFIMLKMAKQDKIPLKLNYEGYLYTICKNLWKKHLIKSEKKVQLAGDFLITEFEESPADKIISEERTEELDLMLSQLCDNCQRLLLYFYYEKKSMKAIAKLLGYASEATAKNKKSKCLKKLRGIILSSKSKKEYFLD